MDKETFNRYLAENRPLKWDLRYLEMARLVSNCNAWLQCFPKVYRNVGEMN